MRYDEKLSRMETSTLAEGLNLQTFIAGLVNDLDELRAGKISTRDAQARALLAKQVLRGVHYVVQARKFLEMEARRLPDPGFRPAAPDGEGG